MSARARCAAGALLCLAAACERAAPTAGALDAVPLWHASPDVQIGSVNGDITFGIVGLVRVGPDGNVYVGDFQRADLQVFSPTGAPIRVIGRQGAGPGEFSRTPTALGWIGDSLWVLDFQSRRLHVFDSAGNVISSRIIPDAAGAPGDRPYRAVSPLPGGMFLAGQSFPSSMVASGEITQAAMVRIDSSGAVIDTVHLRDMRNQTWGISNESGGLYTGQPFGGAPFDLVDEAGETVVHVRWVFEPAPRIDLVRRTLAHDTLLRASVGFTPVPVTDSMVAAVVGRTAEMFRRNRQEVSEAEAQRLARSTLFVPPYLRPVVIVRTAEDGAIWLQLQREDAPTRPALWVVIDAEGRITRRVELPVGFTLHVPATDHVWGAMRDSLDVTTVVRAKLVPRR